MEELYDRDLCPDHLLKTSWECQRQTGLQKHSLGKLLNPHNTHRKSWKSIEETKGASVHTWET